MDMGPTIKVLHTQCSMYMGPTVTQCSMDMGPTVTVLHTQYSMDMGPTVTQCSWTCSFTSAEVFFKLKHLIPSNVAVFQMAINTYNPSKEL